MKIARDIICSVGICSLICAFGAIGWGSVGSVSVITTALLVVLFLGLACCCAGIEWALEQGDDE